METEPKTEPWMRGTHPDLDPLRRAVVHALELAEEDATRWCAGLDEASLLRHLRVYHRWRSTCGTWADRWTAS